MTLKFRWRAAVLIGVVAAMAVPASATVIDGADVGGYRTFVDQNTGRVWLDLDNFFGLTYNQMASGATGAGFAVASKDDVNGLLASLPLTGGEWFSYAAIMGSAPNRELIWGAYVPVTPGVLAWAYAYSDTGWQFNDNALLDLDTVPNANSGAADMNIWAYQTGAPVPEPASLLLFGSGLMGLVLRRRR